MAFLGTGPACPSKVPSSHRCPALSKASPVSGTSSQSDLRSWPSLFKSQTSTLRININTTKNYYQSTPLLGLGHQHLIKEKRFEPNRLNPHSSAACRLRRLGHLGLRLTGLNGGLAGGFLLGAPGAVAA